MTNPANDETKKEEKVTSSTGTPPAKDADSTAPKKRKRKRRAKKSVTPVATPTKETTKDEKQHTAPHKADAPPHEHTKKTVEPKKQAEKEEKTKKEEPTDKKTATEESKKPNLDIKSEAHMLPGIDNIHEYIARKKATSSPSHEKKEAASSFITPDGTDLLTLPKIYAVVPHSKGDHKLVYMKEDAPEGLIDDPRKRTPGNMYVKNGRDIYMVTLTMKEHPTLKDEHGEAYDVWIIDTADQLTNQISAIKQGMGGGENFGEVIIMSGGNKESNTEMPSIIQPVEVIPPNEGDKVKAAEQIIDEGGVSQEVTEIPEAGNDETHEEDTEAIMLPTQKDEENILADIPETAIDTIDLNLPTDEDLPEIDIEKSIPEIDFTPEETLETEQSQEITLDMDIASGEETPKTKQSTSDDMSNEPQSIQRETEETSEEITLDMPESQLSEESSEEDTLHFTAPEVILENGTIETSPEESGSLFVAPQDISVSLPEEEHTESGMFHEPVITNQASDLQTSSETATPHIAETSTTSPTDLFFSPNQVNMMPGTSSTTENNESSIVIPAKQLTAANSFDLDNLSIESSEHTDQSIDLDNLPTTGNTSDTVSSTTVNNLSSHSHPLPPKSKFPFHIVIRIVLFILIAGALVLVRKVMFPAIKGAKPIDNGETTTGQLIDNTNEPTTGDTAPIGDSQENPEPTTGTILPTDTTDTQDNGINTPPEDNTDTPPTSLTLNELTEKLQSQQTEARKVLNIAKLLENKQAIKFSLAAMLKAGNVLERIETETTITAQDVLQESQKIDRYLMDANKLIE